jgi:hypothetical protein
MESAESLYMNTGNPGEAELFRRLVDCLECERKHLMESNIEGLWAVMEDKKGIVEAIEAIPAEERGREPEVSRLKDEIRQRTKENTAFVRESLEFFNELIDILAGGRVQSRGYRPSGSGSSEARPPLYQRKV